MSWARHLTYSRSGSCYSPVARILLASVFLAVGGASPVLAQQQPADSAERGIKVEPAPPASDVPTPAPGRVNTCLPRGGCTMLPDGTCRIRITDSVPALPLPLDAGGTGNSTNATPNADAASGSGGATTPDAFPNTNEPFDSNLYLNEEDYFDPFTNRLAGGRFGSAPNMIGDFFGSGQSSPATIFRRGTPISVGLGFGRDLPGVPGYPVDLPTIGTDPVSFNLVNPTVILLTQDSLNVINDNFRNDPSPDDYALQMNPDYTQFIINFLNSDTRFQPGQTAGAPGEIIAPTGPDFDSTSVNITSLRAEYEPGTGNAPGTALNLSGAEQFFLVSDQDIQPLVSISSSPTSIPGGNIAAAPGIQIGRMKLAENSSPIPRDRAFVNYSYFDNTPLFPAGVNVNRVTPGFERTIIDGLFSVEVRAPFATTLDSDVKQGGITSTSNAEFGNMTLYFKALLRTENNFALSGGLGVTFPTADDLIIRDVSTGNPVVAVTNKSVHLLPFVGGLYMPDDRLFIQSFLQFDFDTNGNPVQGSDFTSGGSPTGTLTQLGRGNDQAYVFFDLSIGYWIYRDENSGRLITGVAPILEYHLNQTISDGDRIAGAADNVVYDFGQPGDINVSNGVVGLTTELNNRATVTAAYTAPLGGSDQQFDGEFRLTFNWNFGPNGTPSGRNRNFAAENESFAPAYQSFARGNSTVSPGRVYVSSLASTETR